jgi:hypothetical protein
MQLGLLGRRSIGRNLATQRSLNEFYFFTDVDHVFTAECLDRIPEIYHELTHSPVRAFSPLISMFYPRDIMIHKDHTTGDAYAQSKEDLPDINPEDFIPKHYNRAIGGVQICPSEFVKEHGYLNRFPVWQQPRTDDKPFKDFRDDVAFRKLCEAEGMVYGVDIPGIYRLRHTHTSYQDPKVSNEAA